MEGDGFMGAERGYTASSADMKGREEGLHLPNETPTSALGMWEDLGCRLSL